MRAMVCLPTYNERDNLEPMVHALGEQIDTTRDRVLVIDDNSPDGTGAIADGLAAELPWVEVLHRGEKEGLGKAYLAGFHHALAEGAELVLEIDCDFSHDPREVPRLVATCEAGADLVLGSRWVEGGGTVNWGRGRTFVSRGGSFYARTILGVGVRDLTGGFKCFRRIVLETIDLDAIEAKGYGFQIETTYRALRAGFRVVEIPITFVDRRVGESKMDSSIVVEAMLQVPVLRYRALRGTLSGSRTPGRSA
jgi:dolichol-phosphate mannosyltransferase